MNALRLSAKVESWFRPVGLTFLVAALCYCADRIVYVLGIPPEHVASFWPATPFLVAVLLLAPKKWWPALIVAGLGVLALADFVNGVPLRAEMWITLGNLIDVIVVTLGTHLLFEGTPNLSSVNALAKYFAIAVIIAPAISALVGAKSSPPSGYWLEWRIWWCADALGFLTVVPAVLGWAQEGRSWARKVRNYPELAALLALLVLVGHFAFMAAEGTSLPALLYLLVPLLLWASLRLGVKGVSVSMIVVAFLAIRGAANDLGPFTGQGPLNNALSLQLFLLFAALPFTVLAAVADEERQRNAERRLAEGALRESEERLRFATQAGRMFAYDWDMRTDVIVRSQDCAEILGLTGDATRTTGEAVLATILPEYRQQVIAAAAELRPENPIYRAAIRALRPDGSTVWLERTGRGFFDAGGKLIRMVGMVADITERMRSAEALQESEARFRNLFRDAGVGMVIVSPDGRFLAANDTFCEYLGYTEDELRQMTVQSVTQPEDWPMFSAKLEEALASGASIRRFEKRCRHKSGHTVYTEATASLIRTPKGEPQYFVGEVLNVTERKVAAASLADANRRLISEQERERTRIARDLHDDINQRLALLAVEIHQLIPTASGSVANMGQRLSELFEKTTEICGDVQSISHRLHPSRLEHLGLVAAVRGHCREVAEQQAIEICFSHDNIPATVSWEASVCLFRVLQEALHNAVKHSNARQFDVQLRGMPEGIRLQVSDSGIGFDAEEAMNRSGLGLVSMRERLRLVEGTLSIATRPGAGTTIAAFVPQVEGKAKGAAN